jgi:hypothetical protein
VSETTWIVIARSDLDDYLLGAGVEALSTAALSPGQTDPFLRVMPDVATRIRAEVRGCRSNKVSNLANSIPPDLKTSACALIVEQMATRLAMGLPLNDDMKKAADKADKYLVRISRCEVPITQPTDPQTTSDVQTGGLIETVQEGNTGNSREELNRL